MKNKAALILIGVTFLTIAFFVVVFRQAKLISPSPSPTPNSIPNSPKQYKYDSSTDLKKELDNINPQVLDSDFE